MIRNTERVKEESVAMCLQTTQFPESWFGTKQIRNDSAKVSYDRDSSSQEPYHERTRTLPYFAAFGTHGDAASGESTVEL